MWNKGVPLENKGVARLLLRENKRACPTYQVCIGRESIPTVTVINKENKMSMRHSPEDKSKTAKELSFNVSKAVVEQPEHGSSLPLMRKQEKLLVEAANIECSDKHPSYREVLVPPGPVNSDPPDAANAKQPSQEAINNIERSMLLRSPESPVALMPPALANPLLVCFPPCSSPELESRLCWKPPDTGARSKQHAYHAVNDRLQSNEMECSPQAEPLTPSADISPEIPDNDLDAENQPTLKHDAYVDKTEAGQYALQVISEGIEVSVVRSSENKSERAEELSPNLSKAVSEQLEHGPSHPLWGKQERLLAEAANAKHTDKRSSCHSGPVLPVLARPKSPDVANVQWPNQEAVRDAGPSVDMRSPKPSTALMLLTSATLATFPMCPLPRSSLELEFQLRWKPPDNGKDPRWNAYHAVNDRQQPNGKKHSPLPGTVLKLSESRYLLAHVAQVIAPRRLSLPLSWRVHTLPSCQHATTWANSPRLMGVELHWRAHCKLPNVTGTVQWHSAGVVSARHNTSIIRSPAHGIAHMLPLRRLTPLLRVSCPSS